MHIKCVLVGDKSANKTELLIRYITDTGPTEYVPTVFDNYEVTFHIGDTSHKLRLFDTAGQEDYDRLRPLSYPQTDVFLMCFSIADATSFKNIKDKWYSEIRHHCPSIPAILVGVNVHRREELGQQRNLIGISMEQGKSLAKKIKALNYIECSTVTGLGVKEVFDEAILAALAPEEFVKNPGVNVLGTIKRAFEGFFTAPLFNDIREAQPNGVLSTSVAQIVDALSVIITSTTLQLFHDTLCTPPHPDAQELFKHYRHGAISRRELLTDMLEHWVVLRGEKATVKKLCNVLQKTTFMSTAEDLKTMFPLHYAITTTDPFVRGYQMVENLGKGSFGIVLKARSETSTPNEVAIKFIFLYKRFSESTTLCREIETIKGLSHGNLVQCLDHVLHKRFTEADIRRLFLSPEIWPNLDDMAQNTVHALISRAQIQKTVGGICIKMELCGSTLRKWLLQNEQELVEPPPPEAGSRPTQYINTYIPPQELVRLRIRVGQGIISGIKFLHSKQVLHRDLKPENIFFSNPGYSLPVKIGDFGLARDIGVDMNSMSASFTAGLGTSLYRAPEVDASHYGKQADLFSLGLILWEVFQIVPYHSLRKYFERLVYDNEADLIQDDQGVTNLRAVVTELTKRNRGDRTKSADDIKLQLASNTIDE